MEQTSIKPAIAPGRRGTVPADYPALRVIVPVRLIHQ